MKVPARPWFAWIGTHAQVHRRLKTPQVSNTAQEYTPTDFWTKRDDIAARSVYVFIFTGLGVQGARSSALILTLLRSLRAICAWMKGFLSS